MSVVHDRERLVELLHRGGCVAPEEETAELVLAFGDRSDELEAAVGRRLRGEPLAWVCGSAEIDGLRLRIDRGVYVPRRWQTPALARAAAALLPPGGTAVDLCAGAGTVAALLLRADPAAQVVATELDPTSARCALGNGVAVFEGDLFEPLPADLAGAVDIVTAVAPYVPTGSLPLLPRDTVAHEPRRALDGGVDGLATVRVIAREAPRWLRPGGWLVVELGADQAEVMGRELRAAGWDPVQPVPGPGGEACGLAARRPTAT